MVHFRFKHDLNIDIGDDIDSLCEIDDQNNINNLFTFVNSEHENIMNEDSRK